MITTWGLHAPLVLTGGVWSPSDTNSPQRGDDVISVSRGAALWTNDDAGHWAEALARYPDVIAVQQVPALPALDEWIRESLPGAIAQRTPPCIEHEELVRVTEWKMHRGVWRAPNLVRVRSNDHATVRDTSASALAQVPHPTRPISTMATLDGVGPATASAVLAAAVPECYPFFDELVAAAVPGLGPVAWTLGYYARYAVALRDRAARLGSTWTAVQVERAVWASLGGKVGVAS